MVEMPLWGLGVSERRGLSKHENLTEDLLGHVKGSGEPLKGDACY